MTGRAGVTAIVLAGGRSSRFGGPKLAAELDGLPLLDHAIRAVGAVADEILMVGARIQNPAPGSVTAVPIRAVADEQPFAGPLAALAGALREIPTELAIVVGGDMPRLVPAVLDSMLLRLASNGGVDAVVLADVDAESPRRQVLPLALRVGPAAIAAAMAIDGGDRSLVRLLDRLGFLEIPASEWLALDPSGQTALDVDTAADLERLRGRKIR